MKRLSFFLTLIVTAALGSVFVASAQDPQEAPPAAPAAADEGDEAAPDAAPADEAPADEAPADEAPADDAPPSDEPPMDEPSGDDPMDGPEGDEPMDSGDEPMEGADEPAEGTDAAPDQAPEAAPAPAPAPAKKKSSALSSLSVEEGQAQLERTAKQAGAEPRRATLEEGTQVGLTTRDTALLDAESSGIAKFGGCEVTLSENTTFKVIEVGDEMSIVEILGVELELERGTILEAAFGSLAVTVRAGRTTARNTSGAPQVISFTTVNPDGSMTQMTVTVPAAPPGQPAPSISTDSSGNLSIGSTPLTVVSQPLTASGEPAGPPVTSTVQPGQNLGTALGGGATDGASANVVIQSLADGTQAANGDAPPVGTLPGLSDPTDPTSTASDGL
jgi:hypothetical protein